jgi:hypothetical protein
MPFTELKLTVHHVLTVDPTAVAAGMAFKSIDKAVECAVKNNFEGYFIDQKLDQVSSLFARTGSHIYHTHAVVLTAFVF